MILDEVYIVKFEKYSENRKIVVESIYDDLKKLKV